MQNTVREVARMLMTRTFSCLNCVNKWKQSECCDNRHLRSPAPEWACRKWSADSVLLTTWLPPLQSLPPVHQNKFGFNLALQIVFSICGGSHRAESFFSYAVQRIKVHMVVTRPGRVRCVCRDSRRTGSLGRQRIVFDSRVGNVIGWKHEDCIGLETGFAQATSTQFHVPCGTTRAKLRQTSRQGHNA